MGTSALLPVTLELDDGCSIIIFAIVIVASRRDLIKLSLSWTACRGGAINVFRCPVATFVEMLQIFCQPQSPEVDKHHRGGLRTKSVQQYSVRRYSVLYTINIRLHKAEHNRRSSFCWKVPSFFIVICLQSALKRNISSHLGFL